jgi:transposase-like protein
MVSLSTIIAEINKLSASDKVRLKNYLMGASPSKPTSLASFVGKERFTGGFVCPICNSKHIVRFGHRADGTQRYKCKDCGKTFVSTSNSIVSGSRISLSVWKKYIECMMYGLSVRECADICRIHRNTAFAWRHKILGALQNMAESVSLDGIIEADETFFPISYKGNHKHSTFKMPRKAHKRGHSTHLRGLSHEKVCVPCAVNRNGLSIAKATNLGRVATRNLHSLYGNRIEKGSVMVTDRMNSYRRFANQNDIELVQLKGGKSKKGIYNIQHINSYHSELKRFMENFKGVSTKHLNNYLIWHNFVNYAPENYAEKKAIMLGFVLSQKLLITFNTISDKPALPFVT